MFAQRNVLTLTLLLIILVFSAVVPATAAAQGTCAAIVSDALSSLGTDCANLSANTTCYGNEEIVKAVFTEDVPSGFYSQPGDRADLTETAAIQTGAFEPATGNWGLNVMNVTANVPVSLAKGVVFVQFGGVEVENGVEPEDAAETGGDGAYTPMQRFYLRTGIDGAPCWDAPSLLFIQGPNGVPVDLWVFDQHIQIQSTIVLRINEAEGTLELIVLSGLVILYPGTAQEMIVPPGYVTSIPLGGDPASLGIEGDADELGVLGVWSPPRPLANNELAELEPVEEIPGNLIYYPVELPMIVRASSVGGVIPVLVFPNAEAVSLAIAACAAGELPEDICEYLDAAG